MDVKELNQVKNALKFIKNHTNDYIVIKNNEDEEIEKNCKKDDSIKIKTNIFYDYLVEFIKQYENELLNCDFEEFACYINRVIEWTFYNRDYDIWKKPKEIKTVAENYIKEFLED